jgi:3-isopropylmalate dehydrogenase
MSHKILILPGDGVGPEIVAEAVKLLGALQQAGDLSVELEHADVGGAGLDASGCPLPEQTLGLARDADAILLGAVGGPKWDCVERRLRPEQGLLSLRAKLGVFANLRPALTCPQLVDASTLKADIVSGLDLMIVRELTGGIYFGQPRGVRTLDDGQRQAFNTLVYAESEIERICRIAFDLSMKRGRQVCSVDKSNVLEVSVLWREVAERVGGGYPEVALSHMYVDNAAMQLVREPRQFDVLVTSNMFGDILSDLASMLTGSIGMLPSASMDSAGKGLYEPVHGSAPDIAGQGIANPLATTLSVAMMLRYTLGAPELAQRIESAVARVLDQGLRTRDIQSPGTRVVGTGEMGDAIVAAL